MSNRRREKYYSQGSSSQFPTVWSGWEWNIQYNCYSRSRLKGPEDYEYEYGPVQGLSSDLQPIPESGPAYSSSVHYTTSSIDTVTRGLNQIALSPAATLQSSVPSSNWIKTRNEKSTQERFDSRYKVHPEREFKWGKIFKVLWTEPRGNAGSEDATESVREGRYGEKHYEKVRRFVIIEEKRGHCTCLPINTYSNQGINKHGVHAADHTIIYTDSPTFVDGEQEKGLTRTPIKVAPNTARDKLAPASRLNYAKVYTVEYNVKVWFIGKIHRDSEYQVSADYNSLHPPLSHGIPPTITAEETSTYVGNTTTATYPNTIAAYSAANSSFPAATGTYSAAASDSTPRSYSDPAYSISYPSASALYPTAQSSLQPYGPSNVVGTSLYPASTTYDNFAATSQAPVPTTSYPTSGVQDILQDQADSTAQPTTIGYETDEDLFGANENSSHKKGKSSRRHRK